MRSEYMNVTTCFEVVVVVGTRRSRLTASDLPPDVRDALLRLAFRTEGGGRGRENASENAMSIPEERESSAFPLALIPGRDEGLRGEGRGERLVEIAFDIAHHLAATLRDSRSLAWYRCIARRLPLEVIQDALARAMEPPEHEVRRSRAALFTAIVKRRLARLSTPDANTPHPAP